MASKNPSFRGAADAVSSVWVLVRLRRGALVYFGFLLGLFQ
jgi:hypothetical protein